MINFQKRLIATLALPLALVAQTPLAVAPPAQIQSELTQSLTGDWTGVLEYRDYSEPATSTKRVQLPTWLAISRLGMNLSERFTYDDGPTKVVEDSQVVTFDVATSKYIEDTGKAGQSYDVAGYEKLKSGRGEIVLIGNTTDNDKPAETRITLTIRRNLLSWTEEVRPAGSASPFAFRHRYTFTRATAPKVTASR